jgi:perosamine synthetase
MKGPVIAVGLLARACSAPMYALPPQYPRSPASSGRIGHKTGRVMVRTKVPAQRYDFPDEDVELVLERLRGLLSSRAFLTLGRYVEQFESEFATLTGTSHAVATSSGTAALEAILRSLGVAGAEVVVPTNTFAATAFAVLHAGGRPVFADCGDDLNLDPADVQRQLTDRTKAVIAVHVGGLISPSVVALQELCRDRGIALVEDAAHAHGSTLNGRAAGAFGDAAAYSFFSTKVMTTGEGGMVVTDRQDIAESARVIRDQGKVGGRNLHEVEGHNWRMTEFQAILGLAQLSRLPDFIRERRRVAQIYDKRLDGFNQCLRPIPAPAESSANYYKYIVVVEGQEIGELRNRLADEFGVKLGGFVYDTPCHEQPVFAAFARNRLPHAEYLCRHHICPPIYPSLDDRDANFVADALLEVVS